METSIEKIYGLINGQIFILIEDIIRFGTNFLTNDNIIIMCGKAIVSSNEIIVIELTNTYFSAFVSKLEENKK